MSPVCEISGYAWTMRKGLKVYLRILACAYFLGAALHLSDLADLRLKFTEMNAVWKLWIIYLLVFDTIAAVGLWRLKKWGEYTFLFIASSQLFAYMFFIQVFGPQWLLVGFHCITITLYLAFMWSSDRRSVLRMQFKRGPH